MCGYYPPNTWLYFRTTTWPNVWSECPSGPCLDDGITQQQCPVGTKGLKVWSSVAVANLLRHFMCCAFRSALLHSLVVIGGYLSYYCLPISLSFISSTKWTWLFGKMLADQQFLKYWNKAASLTPTTIPHSKSLSSSLWFSLWTSAGRQIFVWKSSWSGKGIWLSGCVWIILHHYIIQLTIFCSVSDFSTHYVVPQLQQW